MRLLLRRPLVRDVLIALGLAALIIVVFIVSADTTPTWIYQGF